MVGAMTTRGVLDDGATHDYAHGLMLGTHRGLQTVGHSGADAGFRAQARPLPHLPLGSAPQTTAPWSDGPRAQVLWYPALRLGVAVASNLATADPGRRVRAQPLPPSPPSACRLASHRHRVVYGRAC